MSIVVRFVKVKLLSLLLISWLVILATLTIPIIAEGQVSFLQRSDLPSRFEQAPSFVESLIMNSMNSLNQELEKEERVLEEVKVFLDLEQVEMVIGITIVLNNLSARETWDQGLQSKEVSKIFTEGLRKSLSSWGTIKITQEQEIEGLERIGDLSRGFRLKGKLEKLSIPVSTEAIAFRREQKGVLVIVSALSEEIGEIQVKKLAVTLDKRLQNLSKS